MIAMLGQKQNTHFGANMRATALIFINVLLAERGDQYFVKTDA